MTLVVALAALLAFNMAFIDRLFLSSGDGIRAAAFVGPARVLFFTIAACTVGGLVGCFTAITIWRSMPPGAWPAVRGGVAGLAAGFLSWFFGLVLLFIGYGVDGQAPLSALIMGVLGAALNLIPGALLGTCWVGFKRRNRASPRSHHPLECRCMNDHRNNCTFRGLIIGIVVMIVIWFVPLPVAAVVYLFGITHPFGDVMLFCIPLFLLIPVIGAIIGSRIRRTDGGVGEAPSGRQPEESGLACLNQLTPIARTEES